MNELSNNDPPLVVMKLQPPANNCPDQVLILTPSQSTEEQLRGDGQEEQQEGPGSCSSHLRTQTPRWRDGGEQQLRQQAQEEELEQRRAWHEWQGTRVNPDAVELRGARLSVNTKYSTFSDLNQIN